MKTYFRSNRRPSIGDRVKSELTGYEYIVDLVLPSRRIMLTNTVTHVTIDWCGFEPKYFKFIGRY